MFFKLSTSFLQVFAVLMLQLLTTVGFICLFLFRLEWNCYVLVFLHRRHYTATRPQTESWSRDIVSQDRQTYRQTDR